MWDKKGENLTYKWLTLLKEQNEKNVLIVGDSQSGGIGRRLESKLKSAGYNVVRITRSGRDTAAILSAIKKINPNEFDVAYIFAGGARTYNPSPDKPVNVNTGAIENMLNFLSGVKRVVWVGPPPATKITNLSTTKKIFGDKVTNEDFWISTGTARRREEKNEIIKGIVDDAGRVFYDVRNLLSPFPDQPDGIHVVGSSAEAVADDLVKFTGEVDRSARRDVDIEKIERAFTGSRLATSELRGLDLVQLARYAQSRASACQGMGYFTIGSKGEEVKQIQDKLVELGYGAPNKDEEAYGTFDLRTLYNILAFQKMSKIRTDGCVGPETTRALGVKPATKVDVGPATDEDYKVQRFKPYSAEATALFKKAAEYLNLSPEVFVTDDLHYILQKESQGYVGKPNYTFGKVYLNKNADQWGDIWNRLRQGEVWTKSTATGLGQLLSSNVKAFYPDGLQGIGDPFNEAVGMLAYIKRRYGTPEIARSVYGRKGNYIHGDPPGPRPWCKGPNRSQCRKGFKEGY